MKEQLGVENFSILFLILEVRQRKQIGLEKEEIPLKGKGTMVKEETVERPSSENSGRLSGAWREGQDMMR